MSLSDAPRPAAYQPQTGSTAPTLICIISSAGGLRALSTLLQHLPDHLNAAIIIVQHLDPDHRSRLVEILRRYTNAEVCGVRDGEPIRQGVIHVASPDVHVLVDEHQRIHLTHTKKVLHVRPSGNLLLKSAAEHFQGRVIGIILTGRMSDGSDGVQAVHDAGGIVFAQDPASAQHRGMPDAAIATGAVDYVLSLEQMSQQLVTILETGTLV